MAVLSRIVRLADFLLYILVMFPSIFKGALCNIVSELKRNNLIFTFNVIEHLFTSLLWNYRWKISLCLILTHCIITCFKKLRRPLIIFVQIWPFRYLVTVGVQHDTLAFLPTSFNFTSGSILFLGVQVRNEQDPKDDWFWSVIQVTGTESKSACKRSNTHKYQFNPLKKLLSAPVKFKWV